MILRKLTGFILVTIALIAGEDVVAGTLTTAALKKYAEQFNAQDQELYPQAIPNSEAVAFLSRNIPLFECPEKNVESTYYFRWWTYRKHIRQTPDGYIITEFLPKVPWSGKYNAIPCSGTHQYREGRWLHDSTYLQDYTAFWLQHSGTNPKYKGLKCVLGHGFPLPDALWQLHLVHPCANLLIKFMPEMAANYEELKKRRKTETKLYWSKDGGWEGDGMEMAIGGPGIRPTFNSYMFAQATALSEIALIKGDTKQAQYYVEEAELIRSQIVELLWDEQNNFFTVMRFRDIPQRKLAEVRELLGYVPWYYSIPPKGRGYEEAWRQLMDPEGFRAPYGPTTAEQRHPGFLVDYNGHECQWNGPSWPYATAQTLTAMANVLQDYPQDVISRRDYFDSFLTYTKCHKLEKEDGSVVPWIDENLNPYTGDWLARTRLKTWKNGIWSNEKGGIERGKDYNHSTYADLVITGLVGLRPRSDDVIEVDPLLPDDTWDYFCLDNVSYHGRLITIVWDETGDKYKKGKGLRVFSSGELVASSATLSRIAGKLK